VTGDVASVCKEGLKSRAQLLAEQNIEAMESGVGIPGRDYATDNFISFTRSKDKAIALKQDLITAMKIARGEVTSKNIANYLDEVDAIPSMAEKPSMIWKATISGGRHCYDTNFSNRHAARLDYSTTLASTPVDVALLDQNVITHCDTPLTRRQWIRRYPRARGFSVIAPARGDDAPSKCAMIQHPPGDDEGRFQLFSLFSKCYSELREQRGGHEPPYLVRTDLKQLEKQDQSRVGVIKASVALPVSMEEITRLASTRSYKLSAEDVKKIDAIGKDGIWITHGYMDEVLVHPSRVLRIDRMPG
jgi:hypothetical protein